MPLGARIRGLFLVAIKTGNPLVDSVAEHQPGNEQSYDSFLGNSRYVALVGLLFCWHQKSPAKYFAPLYAAVAYHYSLKMSRLILICAPIVSVLAGYPLGIVGDWCIEQFVCLLGGKAAPAVDEELAPLRAGGMGSIFRCTLVKCKRCVQPKELLDAVKAKDRFAENLPVIDRPLRAMLAASI